MYASNLLDVCVVRTTDELFQVGKSVGFRECEDKFSLHVRFSRLLPGHLQVADQVLPVFCEMTKDVVFILGV